MTLPIRATSTSWPVRSSPGTPSNAERRSPEVTTPSSPTCPVWSIRASPSPRSLTMEAASSPSIEGTGGLVTIGTVTAQLLYEIGAPAYANPDATALFDTIVLDQVGREPSVDQRGPRCGTAVHVEGRGHLPRWFPQLTVPGHHGIGPRCEGRPGAAHDRRRRPG